MTSYSRTDKKGNITVHAAPAKGAAPLCGAGSGVDGYWRESGEAVQCRRCLSLLTKRASAPAQSEDR